MKRFVCYITVTMVNSFIVRCKLNSVRKPSYAYLASTRRVSIKQLGNRAYSTSASSPSTENSALAVFSDADNDKLDILDFVKGKSGIYM